MNISILLFSPKIPHFSPNHILFLQMTTCLSKIFRLFWKIAVLMVRTSDWTYPIPETFPFFNHKTEIWRRWSSGRLRKRAWDSIQHISPKLVFLSFHYGWAAGPAEIYNFFLQNAIFFSKTYNNFLQNAFFSPKHTTFSPSKPQKGGANLQHFGGCRSLGAASPMSQGPLWRAVACSLLDFLRQ